MAQNKMSSTTKRHGKNNKMKRQICSILNITYITFKSFIKLKHRKPSVGSITMDIVIM